MRTYMSRSKRIGMIGAAVLTGFAMTASPAMAAVAEPEPTTSDTSVVSETSSTISVTDSTETTSPSETGTEVTETGGVTTPSSSVTSEPEEPEVDPSIKTSAGEKVGNFLSKGGSIIDTVTYEGLTPGEKYTLEASTVDTQSGLPDGNKGELEFTPTDSSGSVDVTIKLEKEPASQVVVFEKLLDSNGEVVASHEDKEDKAQTVGELKGPEIETVASANTERIQTGTIVEDLVKYSGLTAGQSYKLEARLMCKDNGADTGASKSLEFEAKADIGEVTVEGIAVVDPDCATQVVFQKLYDAAGSLVVSHEDINNMDQTVGAGANGKKLDPKKKKKIGDPEEVVEAPALPEAEANADANAKPGGLGPRQIINSVPSGTFNGGMDIFTK